MIPPLALAVMIKRIAAQTRGPASAFFFPHPRGQDILEATFKAPYRPRGQIHAAGEGILLVVPVPSYLIVPGAIRLKSIASHLHIPIAAELTPALLDEEAEGDDPRSRACVPSRRARAGVSPRSSARSGSIPRGCASSTIAGGDRFPNRRG